MLFDWDQWNLQKNEIKHGVSASEAESTFADKAHSLFDDEMHSKTNELRFILYGKSFKDRVLMLGFTVRANKISIITARPASQKESTIYAEKK